MRGQRGGQAAHAAAEIEGVIAAGAHSKPVEIGHRISDLSPPAGQEFPDIPAATLLGGVYGDRPERISLPQPGPVAAQPGQPTAGGHDRR